MSQKNETPVLVLAFLITAALLGGGYWWFTRSKSNSTNPQISNSPSPTNSSNQASPIQASGNGFSQVKDVPDGLFSYGGSTSFAPIRGIVDSVIQSEKPGFKLRYFNAANSSSSGIKLLLDGQLNFAQSSRPILDTEYTQAQQRGFKLQQIPIAIDGLAIAVNPNLNIPGLTLSQLKSIYTGQVTNWQQVGGPNLPIQAISRPPNSGGTVEQFSEQVLGGSQFNPKVQLISTTTEAIRRVASSPGGIYYASASEIVDQCSIKPLPIGTQSGQFIAPYEGNLVTLSQCQSGQKNQVNIEAFQKGQYPITRNLFVIVKLDGQDDEKAGKAYANLLLSAQGQELIKKAGFVQIR